MNSHREKRQCVLQDMTNTAEKLISTIPFSNPKDAQSLQYELVCLWIAISMNQITLLFPPARNILKPILALVIDADIETREWKADDNGILSLEKKSGDTSTTS